MRERLIDLLKVRQTHGQKWDYCENGQSIETVSNDKLADYLIANGVIVPPCKVGDTVYQTDGVRIYKGTIINVIYDTYNISFDERAIGKTVFLTREEAEKALKEREGKCQKS